MIRTLTIVTAVVKPPRSPNNGLYYQWLMSIFSLPLH